MVGASLRQLANNATPGPWVYAMGALRRDHRSQLRLARFDDWNGSNAPETDGEANARLAALAPDLARWAADAADWMGRVRIQGEPVIQTEDALLTRLAEITGDS